MDIQEWLSRGWDLSSRIAEIEEEKQRLYEIATRTIKGHKSDRVQTSLTNTSEDKMTAYSSACITLDEERDKLLSILNEIINLINLIEDITYRRLLSMRYIELMKWEDIAEKLCYNTRHIHRLHTKALSKAEAILNNK